MIYKKGMKKYCFALFCAVVQLSVVQTKNTLQ